VFNFRTSSFQGIGPSLGGKVAVPVLGKLAVEGSFMGSLLFGHLDSKRPGNFAGSAFPIATRNFHSDHTAGTAESSRSPT
jgi:hypothetical protein